MFEDNVDQQIGFSFIDEVAVYDAWEIVCCFKGIENKRMMSLATKENLDNIITELTQGELGNTIIGELYMHYYSDDVG